MRKNEEIHASARRLKRAGGLMRALRRGAAMIFMFSALAGGVYSCSEGGGDDGKGNNHQTKHMPVTTTIGQFSANAADGSPLSAGVTGFEAGDVIGIIVVEDGEVKQNNIPYVLDKSKGWVPQRQDTVYFFTDAEYVAYYPYSADMEGAKSPAEITSLFTPRADQTDEEKGYLASDLLLWRGVAQGADAASAKLDISFEHAMALMVVDPAMEPPHGEIAGAEVSVTAGGVKYEAYGHGGAYYALVKGDGLAVVRVSYQYGGSTYQWDTADNPGAVYGGYYTQSYYGAVTRPEPSGYYASAWGKSGQTLRVTLQYIIDDHTVISYKGLWTAFKDTDRKPDGTIWDMYSDVPGGTPAYVYTFKVDQCGGSISGEGSCYNREHSFPKSWFNDASPMESDLFHLYPTDGKVNGWRDNLPFGEVKTASITSTNGSKVGSSGYPGYTGTVFEPIDEYKGDFARTYFYMLTRYASRISSWNSAMLSGDDFASWARNMLLEWHRQDPVSPKETNRNEAVYQYQANRNPFIDHPELAEHIWGNKSAQPFYPAE